MIVDACLLSQAEKTFRLPRVIERRAPSNPECYGSYSFLLKLQSGPTHRIQGRAPKPGTEEETTGGTRRSRGPTMPSFSGFRRRLPSPLHSTGTVYIHLTATLTKKTDRKTDNPPEKIKPMPSPELVA
ncbi:hypothetical protein Bca101_007056 [Brassica carinata]